MYLKINRRFKDTDFHQTDANWMDLFKEIQTIPL
jgi:hypothetical protein